MDMQLFWDALAPVINIGVWVGLGLFIRYLIIRLKSKRQLNRMYSRYKKSSLPFWQTTLFYILLISACIIFPTKDAKLSRDFTFTKLLPKIFCTFGISASSPVKAQST